MKIFRIMTLATVMTMCACSQPRTTMNMQAMLDKMRLMVLQSTLMATQAACADNPTRAELITASVVLLRRATAGPEMAGLHVMMGGDMNMDQPGGAEGRGPPREAQMPEHTAVHAASGALFDLLETLPLPDAPNCAGMQPVALAASAALLRQPPEQTADEATRKLDQDMAQTAVKLGGLVKSGGEQASPVVRALVADLEKI